MQIKKHLALLGLNVQDKVTGIKGVVVTIGFDLFGCVQAIIHPGEDKDGKPKDTLWMDVARLKVLSETPVMQLPDFDFGPQAEGRQGASEKPGFYKS